MACISLALAFALYRASQSPKLLEKRAHGNVSFLQEALHDYHQAHGTYPVALAELRAAGLLRRLRNPYGGGELPFIRPGEPAQPGGVTYLVWRDIRTGQVVGYNLFGYGQAPRGRCAKPVHPEEVRVWSDLPLDYCISFSAVGEQLQDYFVLEVGQP